MTSVLVLLERVEELLVLADTIDEECYRIVVEGNHVSAEVAQLCTDIESICSSLSIAPPTFKADGTILDDADELNDYSGRGICSWNMILSKETIINKLVSGMDFADEKDNLLYFSESAVIKWIESINPFTVSESDMGPSFDNDIIVWLNNSKIRFGGNKIAVFPVGNTDFPEIQSKPLPERKDISELVRTNGDELLKIRPDTFVILWGDKTNALAESIMHLAIKSLVASISYELKKCDSSYLITFKGTKSFTADLNAKCNAPIEKLQNDLIKTVRWVYSERCETRQQLVMDCLSLDMNATNNFYDELNENLSVSLQQSQDSYAFVILDRKDAYHKEMRELLKDMRSQADMYASKVRDIVGNVTRDTLGVFAFVGYSFLGKFDKANISELLKSHELSLLVKFLAGYLVLSFIMQLTIHLRDSSLTTRESKEWLRVLQRYTSREENKESFLKPIRKRKKTLNWALVIMGIIYITLAASTWNLPKIALWLLS